MNENFKQNLGLPRIEDFEQIKKRSCCSGRCLFFIFSLIVTIACLAGYLIYIKNIKVSTLEPPIFPRKEVTIIEENTSKLQEQQPLEPTLPPRQTSRNSYSLK